MHNHPLDISTLLVGQRTGNLTPTSIVEQVYDRISDKHPNWIYIRDKDSVLRSAKFMATIKNASMLPLYGIPFAVKDNMDVQGLPTTAGCVAYSRVAKTTAPAVQKLLDAGAILIGKTNMDQFATGLTGTRSVFGTPHSVYSDLHIAGGSSSGSACVAARNIVSFTLGTDTAGSGRIPAAYNGIYGLKPTKGTISSRNIVPACRTQDTVSIFSTDLDSVRIVYDVLKGADDFDPFSRSIPPTLSNEYQKTLRFGIPQKQYLLTLSENYSKEWQKILVLLEHVGELRTNFDYSTYHEAGSLLYQGGFLCERPTGNAEFLEKNLGALLPTTAGIFAKGQEFTGQQVWETIYKAAEHSQVMEIAFRDIDVLIVPTAPFHPTIEAVQKEPLRIASEIGIFATAANILDLSALSIPVGLCADGLPFSITILAPKFREERLIKLATRIRLIVAGASST